MKKYLLGIGITLLATQAYACEEESITMISSSGSIIQTDGGSTYTVVAGDRSTASSWSVGDDVLVCDGKMVNKDDGEEIEVVER
jgi:hypothetical protein